MGILEDHPDRWEAITETGCFIWTGSHNGKYPRYNGRYVHRVVLEETMGSPPVETEASHICHTPMCVNPAHLAWETPSVNNMRKTKAQRRLGGLRSGQVKRAAAHGTSLDHRRGLWRARATIDGKPNWIGYFKTEIAAIAAYNNFTGRKKA